MDYTFLKPEDQARIIKQRVARIEKEHFLATLDTEEGVVDNSHLPEIEDRLKTNKDRLTEIEAKIKKPKA